MGILNLNWQQEPKRVYSGEFYDPDHGRLHKVELREDLDRRSCLGACERWIPWPSYHTTRVCDPK